MHRRITNIEKALARLELALANVHNPPTPSFQTPSPPDPRNIGIDTMLIKIDKIGDFVSASFQTPIITSASVHSMYLAEMKFKILLRHDMGFRLEYKDGDFSATKDIHYDYVGKTGEIKWDVVTKIDKPHVVNRWVNGGLVVERGIIIAEGLHIFLMPDIPIHAHGRREGHHEQFWDSLLRESDTGSTCLLLGSEDDVRFAYLRASSGNIYMYLSKGDRMFLFCQTLFREL